MYGEGILKGMVLTFKTMLGKRFTVRYPMEKKAPEDRFRGSLVLLVDESGEALCRACGICTKNCPDKLPKMEGRPDNKNKCFNYHVFMGRCMFCGICTETCPFNALGWSKDYEWANYSREDLELVLMKDGKILRSAPAPKVEKPKPDKPDKSSEKGEAAR